MSLQELKERNICEHLPACEIQSHLKMIWRTRLFPGGALNTVYIAHNIIQVYIYIHTQYYLSCIETLLGNVF